MTGLDHSKAAEAVLAALADSAYPPEIDDRNEYALRLAEVHAQLAIAGGVAALVRTLQRVFEHDPAKAAKASGLVRAASS